MVAKLGNDCEDDEGGGVELKERKASARRRNTGGAGRMEFNESRMSRSREDMPIEGGI
jgi:hypothetical protein